MKNLGQAICKSFGSGLVVGISNVFIGSWKSLQSFQNLGTVPRSQWSSDSVSLALQTPCFFFVDLLGKCASQSHLLMPFFAAQDVENRRCPTVQQLSIVDTSFSKGLRNAPDLLKLCAGVGSFVGQPQPKTLGGGAWYWCWLFGTAMVSKTVRNKVLACLSCHWLHAGSTYIKHINCSSDFTT